MNIAQYDHIKHQLLVKYKQLIISLNPLKHLVRV